MGESRMHLTDREKALIEREKKLLSKLTNEKNAVLSRFPLLFALLVTFGVVATFYGFEGVIDRIDFLSENPFILLGTGVTVLVITGSLYKKLQ